MTENKKTSSKLSLITVCVTCAAFLSFFFPLFTINFFGRISVSGFAAIKELEDFRIAICLICTLISIVFSLISIKKPKAGIVTATVSIIGIILMIAAMSEESDIIWVSAIDYASFGFYLYIIMSFAAIALSIAGLVSSKKTAV